MIIERILNWAVPFILGGLVSGIIAYAQMKSKRERALCDGVQCLLRAEIISYHEKYKAKRFCPIYAKESLKRIYCAYHVLGGNDVATSLYEKTMSLPEVHEEEI